MVQRKSRVKVTSKATMPPPPPPPPPPSSSKNRRCRLTTLLQNQSTRSRRNGSDEIIVSQPPDDSDNVKSTAEDTPDTEADLHPQPKTSGMIHGDLGVKVAVLLISVMTLSLRARYVMDRRNWVVVHPDEIFQSIEVAHTEYYGYGFRPYEFLSPFDEVTRNDTQYRIMEREAGMSAMRSPLYPYFYVLVACLVDGLGIVVNRTLDEANVLVLPLR